MRMLLLNRIELQRQKRAILQVMDESIELLPDLSGLQTQDWVALSGFDLYLQKAIREMIVLDNIYDQIIEEEKKQRQEEKQIKRQLILVGLGIIWALGALYLSIQ